MLWWVATLVLGVGGGVLLGVGLSSQQHAPQPTATQANPSIRTVLVTRTVSVTPTSDATSPGAPRTSTTSAAGAPSVPAKPSASGFGSSNSAPTSSPTLVLPASVPVSVRIPSIGVESSLLQLGLNPDRTIQVPPLLEKDSHAGWYKYSSTPGQLGPAVILGHVDSAKYGPAVFFKLGALQPGAAVEVTRTDGAVAVFTVDRVVSYPKTKFPTDAVYGMTDDAGLRLITCGGTFDPTAGSYESSIVAYATLTSSRPAS